MGWVLPQIVLSDDAGQLQAQLIGMYRAVEKVVDDLNEDLGVLAYAGGRVVDGERPQLALDPFAGPFDLLRPLCESSAQPLDLAGVGARQHLHRAAGEADLVEMEAVADRVGEGGFNCAEHPFLCVRLRLSTPEGSCCDGARGRESPVIRSSGHPVIRRTSTP